MVTKLMRQSSRSAMDIDRQFGHGGRAWKIDADTPTTAVVDTKHPSLWSRFVEWVKKLIGQAV